MKSAVTDASNRPPVIGSDHKLCEGKTDPKLRPRWRRLTADSRVASREKRVWPRTSTSLCFSPHVEACSRPPPGGEGTHQVREHPWGEHSLLTSARGAL